MKDDLLGQANLHFGSKRGYSVFQTPPDLSRISGEELSASKGWRGKPTPSPPGCNTRRAVSGIVARKGRNRVRLTRWGAAGGKSNDQASRTALMIRAMTRAPSIDSPAGLALRGAKARG